MVTYYCVVCRKLWKKPNYSPVKEMGCVVMLKPNRFTEPLCWNSYNILDIIAQNGFIIPLLPFIQFWKKWRQFTIFLLHCCQGIFCQNTKILVFVWGQLSNRKMDSWNLKVRLLFQVIGFGHRINLYFSYIMLTWNRGEFHSCLLFT